MEKSHPSKARLFVALELPEEARGRIVAWQHEVLGEHRELRLVRPESLHVTLVFLGWTAADPYGHVRAASLGRASAARRPQLTVIGLSPVPPRRARLWALDLRDRESRAATIQASMSSALERAGLYTPEKRPFWPHITVARLRSGARPPRIEGPAPAITFEAEAVVLYRSHVSRAGAEYEAIGQSSAFAV